MKDEHKRTMNINDRSSLTRGIGMKRFFQILTAVLPVFAMEAIQSIAVFTLTSLYRGYILLKSKIEPTFDTDVTRYLELSYSYEMRYLYSVIAVAACAVVFLIWYRYETREEARRDIRSVINIKNIFLIILLGIGCQFFVSGLMSFVMPHLGELSEDYTEVLKGITSANSVAVFLFTVVIAPVSEELVFRGVILHKAGRSMPFFIANILQALLFGIVHQNMVQGVYAALLGLLFGYVWRKFHTILAPILVHIFVNASSYLVRLLPADSNEVIIFMVIVGAVLVAVPLYLWKPFKETT